MDTRISDRAFLALAGVAAALFAADAFFVHQVHGLQRETARLEGSVVADLGRLRQGAVITNDEHHDAIEALAAELVAAKYETAAAAGNARAEAQRYAERLARRLVRTRRQQQAWVEGELINIRAVTTAANEAMRRLERQLREARSAALAAVGEHGRAATGTRGLSSDVRALSQLATRQRQDILAARAATAREIFEFFLKKPGEPKEIAGVSLLLRKADPKRNRYSLQIVAGSRTVEANDKTAHEPVRLYGCGERRTFELVVNEIGKNEIRGFIAVPKQAEVARGYSSGSAEIEYLPVR